MKGDKKVQKKKKKYGKGTKRVIMRGGSNRNEKGRGKPVFIRIDFQFCGP